MVGDHGGIVLLVLVINSIGSSSKFQDGLLVVLVLVVLVVLVKLKRVKLQFVERKFGKVIVSLFRSYLEPRRNSTWDF